MFVNFFWFIRSFSDLTYTFSKGKGGRKEERKEGRNEGREEWKEGGSKDGMKKGRKARSTFWVFTS